MSRRSSARLPQHGSALLVVLILVTVMLVGVLSAARLGQLSSLVSGNVATGDAARQATEVGINTAFAAIRTLAAEDADRGGWYFATRRPSDAKGVPTVNWDAVPPLTVGQFTVRYVADRQCSVAVVSDTLRQCLVRQVPQVGSARAGADSLDPPNARQFRVTVRVDGPRGARVYTQALVSRG